jgi:hypothetical protein
MGCGCGKWGSYFPRLLRIIGGQSSSIEPPSQSDRANFQLLSFRLPRHPNPGALVLLARNFRAKGNVISTKLAQSIAPTMETCPNCIGKMTMTEVAPILFTDDLEDVSCARLRTRFVVNCSERSVSYLAKTVEECGRFATLGRRRLDTRAAKPDKSKAIEPVQQSTASGAADATR